MFTDYIKNAIKDMVCTCNPLHIEVGAFDPDCPIHDDRKA